MVIKPLTQKNLADLERASLVDLILEGIGLIETEVKLNELSENPQLTFDNKEMIIKVGNLIKLLEILVREIKFDPLTGKILFEAESLLEYLINLKNSTHRDKIILEKFSAVSTRDIINVDLRLEKVIAHLEAWKILMHQKIKLPRGNWHTRDCYHPEYHETYKFKPSYLPDDYRSNFFFEVHIKELCPFTTTLNISHPYTDIQTSFQENQTLAKLTKVDINVDLVNNIAIEKTDNIRALRLPGLTDDKKYPGSYLILKGGHHRTWALFKKYLEGKVDGELKILIQLVTEKDLTAWNTVNLREEIIRREEIRKKI